ncbi:MAG: hypothetical protein ABJ358_09995 [Rhizobiaceae bacterium]
MNSAVAPFPAAATATAVHRPASLRLESRQSNKLARWTLGLTAFLGAFVIREPAPYELFLLLTMVMFLLLGMRLSRLAITLGLLFVVFNIGGMVSMFTMADYK